MATMGQKGGRVRAFTFQHGGAVAGDLTLSHVYVPGGPGP
jgi:hypothetical protein